MSVPEPLPLTVIVPTYRRPALVRRVVTAALDQLERDDELLVIDDGSGDETTDVLGRIDDPRLRVVSQPNQGPAAARNNGARLATHDLILFVDDDEIPEPGCVAAHRAAHRAPGRRAVMGRAVLIVPHRRDSARVPPGPPGAPTMLDGSSISLRRSEFLESGGFDEQMRGWEDIDLGVRLGTAGVALEVAPGALVTHDIDRSYAVFRQQRMERGRGRAAGRVRHGDIPGANPPWRRTDRWLVWLAVHSGVATEAIAALLWGVVRVGGLVGSWRLQSLAASRAGMMLLARAEDQELTRLRRSPG